MIVSVPEKTSIVLAGSFNPGILTPQWIARHVLQYGADRQFQVEMQAPIAAGVGVPRYSFDGYSYSVSFQKLTFYLGDQTPAACTRVVRAVARLLDLLPHTPLTGLGMNFAFNVTDPRQELLATLTANADMAEAMDPEAAVVGRGWANIVSWRQGIANVMCQLEGDEVNIEVNFHYGLTSAESASQELMRDDAFHSQKAAAIEAANILSHEEIA